MMAKLTPIPLLDEPLVYRSAMPYGPMDDDGELLEAYRAHRIEVVVALCTSRELAASRVDLAQRYRELDIELLHFPFADFGAPSSTAQMTQWLDEIEGHTDRGRAVAVHCWAGLGRTGTLLACWTRRRLGYNANEAIGFVRRHIPGAVQGAAQQDFVHAFMGS